MYLKIEVNTHFLKKGQKRDIKTISVGECAQI